MLHKTDRKLSGFSLAEAMMAVVVLGIAATAVLLPFTSGLAVRAEGMNRTLSAILVSDLMERIANTPFEQIVDSYDGYTEPQGMMKDFNGDVYEDSKYDNFSRDVSCSYVYVPQESEAEEPKFILVVVRVYYSGKQIAIINRLISE